MIYFSFIGNHDQISPSGEYGSFLNIFNNYKEAITKIIILITPKTDRADYSSIAADNIAILKKAKPEIEIILVNVSLLNPVDFDLVYPIMLNESLNIIEKLSLADRPKIINITSGTPTMTACWVLLAQSGLIKNAKLIQSFESKYSKQGETVQEVCFPLDDFPTIQAPSSLKRQLTIKARENKELKFRLTQEELDKKVPDLIGTSKKIREIKDQICSEINSETHVLILGERGTGKEVVATSIWKLHRNDADDKLSVVDCGSIPKELIQSELFGHRKGAFTGASEDREGLLYSAKDKAIFLDEIGNLPLDGQQKLLRVLSHGEIKKVGSNTIEEIKLQIIAATNKDVSDNTLFAQDIKDRFDEIITLPPLRERREDIPILIEHFITKHTAEQNGISPFVLEKALLNKLISFPWPGNIRQLEMMIKKIIRRYPEGGLIKLERIPERYFEEMGTADESELFLPELPLPIPLQEYTEKIIQKARELSKGNMAEVDRLLKQKGAEKVRKARSKK